MGILGTSIRNTEYFYQIRNNSKIVDLWEIVYVRNGIKKNNWGCLEPATEVAGFKI